MVALANERFRDTVVGWTMRAGDYSAARQGGNWPTSHGVDEVTQGRAMGVELVLNDDRRTLENMAVDETAILQVA